jgi:hypothetical protein
MISKKLNNMKKSTAVIVAVLLIAACIADVYQAYLAEIRAMQSEGVKSLTAAVDPELYREPEKTEVIEIIGKTEASINESKDQAEIDALVEKAVADTAGFKTDAVYKTEEEGVEKLKGSIDTSLYREAEKEEINKILKSTEKAISESEDKAEIDALIEEAVSKVAGFKTDAEYTAEEEAARRAAAAAAAKKKSKKNKSSGSSGCVGSGSDVFY